jgi:hypothetical protein
MDQRVEGAGKKSSSYWPAMTRSLFAFSKPLGLDRSSFYASEQLLEFFLNLAYGPMESKVLKRVWCLRLVICRSGQSFEALFAIAPMPQCFVLPSCAFRKARVLAVESQSMGVGSVMESPCKLLSVIISYYLLLLIVCSCKSWLEPLISSFGFGRLQQPEKADCPVVSSKITEAVCNVDGASIGCFFARKLFLVFNKHSVHF